MTGLESLWKTCGYMYLTHTCVKAADVPWETTVVEICEAAELRTGSGNIAGAVRRGNVWRIHARSDADKIVLMAIPSLTIKRKFPEDEEQNAEVEEEEVTVTLHTKNPNNIRTRDGKEVESVKLLIDGLLLSVSNEDLKTSLEKKGDVQKDKTQRTIL